MKNWITRNQKHLIIWAILIVYLFAANPIYIHFFLKNGKPVSENIALPPAAKTVVFKLADMQPVRIDGQDLYQIRGFAFQNYDPSLANTITIVLSSKTQNIAFSTSSVDHPNMIESYPGYTQSMDHDEFSMLLADRVLEPGTYQVGILLEQTGGTTRSYVATGSTIIKTPNTIQYKAVP
jgi:hypothetical protein